MKSIKEDITKVFKSIMMVFLTKDKETRNACKENVKEEIFKINEKWNKKNGSKSKR